MSLEESIKEFASLCSINIGDKVISKRTGLPACGYVTQIITTTTYRQLPYCNGDMKLWDELYPEWHKFPILSVFFMEPQKNMTWEEFLEGNTYNIDCTEELRVLYKHVIPKVRACWYPIQDLKVLEEYEKAN